MRPGIAQTHAAGAPTAAGNSLQQRIALPRRTRPACLVTSNIVSQLPSVPHELFPVEVGRVGVLEADRPILRWDRHRPHPIASRSPPQRLRPPPAVDVGTSIGRVLQDVDHTSAVRRAPDDLVRLRSTKRPHRNQQVGAPQVSHDRLGATQLLELREDQPQPFLYLLVRIEGDTAVSVVDQPRWKRQPQLTTRCLLALPLMETDLDLMQFGFAHDPRQAQEQPIVIGTRIVEAFAIRNQHPE